jgi:hypothetical protein
LHSMGVYQNNEKYIFLAIQYYYLNWDFFFQSHAVQYNIDQICCQMDICWFFLFGRKRPLAAL